MRRGPQTPKIPYPLVQTKDGDLYKVYHLPVGQFDNKRIGLRTSEKRVIDSVNMVDAVNDDKPTLVLMLSPTKGALGMIINTSSPRLGKKVQVIEVLKDRQIRVKEQYQTGKPFDVDPLAVVQCTMDNIM
jgi:hypothetical protein